MKKKVIIAILILLISSCLAICGYGIKKTFIINELKSGYMISKEKNNIHKTEKMTMNNDYKITESYFMDNKYKVIETQFINGIYSKKNKIFDGEKEWNFIEADDEKFYYYLAKERVDSKEKIEAIDKSSLIDMNFFEVLLTDVSKDSNNCYKLERFDFLNKNKNKDVDSEKRFYNFQTGLLVKHEVQFVTMDTILGNYESEEGLVRTTWDYEFDNVTEKDFELPNVDEYKSMESLLK